MVSSTPPAKVAKGGDEGIKKKKRPWRNKVRRKAKYEAEKARKAELRAQGAIEPTIQTPVADGTKKKKTKKGKKKFENENDGKNEKINEESEEEVDDDKDFVKNAEKKLEAGRFRYLNEKLYTMSGTDAWQFFQDDPEAFECYHKGFADQTKKWPNHPLHLIIKWLKRIKEKKLVLDLGCGEANIAEALSEKHKILSFDLVAVNKNVTACDMAKLPVQDETADVVIYCLSLMGTNLLDFLKEARRVLKVGGILKIAEVTSRFVNLRSFCEAICKLGFEQNENRPVTDYFTMLEFKKIAKVENKRPQGLTLKPCLYKKR